MKKIWQVIRENINIYSVGAVVFAGIAVCGMCMAASALPSFERALISGDVETAAVVYNEKLGSMQEKARAEEFIIAVSDEVLERYTLGEVSMDQLKKYTSDLCTFFPFPELMKYKKYSDALESSAVMFSEAEIFERDGKFYDAIAAYSKVGAGDPNYNEATDNIARVKVKYREYLDRTIPVWREAYDLYGATSELNLAREVLPGEYDTVADEFSALKAQYDKENAKNNQLLKISNEGLLETSRGVLMIAPVTNTTDKAVTEYTVVFCAYDGDERVDIASAQKPKESVSYIKCTNDNANLAPHGECGSEFGWKISKESASKINRLEACVVSATFSDGEVWENAYYEFWCADRGIVD